MICKVTDLQIGFSLGSYINKTGWSFSLASGHLICLVGPNGSGKTTLLRALMGERTLLNGRVMVKGMSRSVQKWTAKEVAQMFSYLPQEQPYEPSQTIESFLGLAFVSSQGVWGTTSQDQRELIRKQIKLYELEGIRKKTLDSLSTGEKQRVFLARVFLQPSPIVLLDEPTNHLDPEGQARFWGTLQKLKGEKTVLVSTHDIEFVKKMSDSVLALKDGQLIFSGASEEFFQKGYIRELFPSLGNT